MTTKVLLEHSPIQPWGETGEFALVADTGHIMRIGNDGAEFLSPRQAEKAPKVAALTAQPEPLWDAPQTEDGVAMDVLWNIYTEDGPKLTQKPDGSYGWGGFVDDPETGQRKWADWVDNRVHQQPEDDKLAIKAVRDQKRTIRQQVFRESFIEPARAFGEFIVDNTNMLGDMAVTGIKNAVTSLRRRDLIDTIKRYRSGEYTTTPKPHPSATVAALALYRML